MNENSPYVEPAGQQQEAEASRRLAGALSPAAIDRLLANGTT
jgi:hypothetical protein